MRQGEEADQESINTMWGNGSPGDFDSPSHGSNPCIVATLTQKVPIICVKNFFSCGNYHKIVVCILYDKKHC